MGKPILDATITTAEGKGAGVKVLFDTGSFYTIVRENVLPEGTAIIRYKPERELGTAGQEGKIRICGATDLIFSIGDKMIDDRALVSPDLRSELIIGAKTMQSWDITVRNQNGKTDVVVGHDMHDPEITEVV